MGIFADKAEVEIGVTSGVLRVSVRPQPTPVSLMVTAAVIVAFVALCISTWQEAAFLERMGEIFVTIGAVFAWFQQLSGAEEEIEIGDWGIRIRKEAFGWSRVAEYSIEQCSDLDLQTNKGDSRQL